MLGPGAYRPDPTAGMITIADLPPPEIVPSRRNDTRQLCPRGGHSAYRDKQAQRTLHALGNLDAWCRRDLVVTSSQHSWTPGQQDCPAALAELAPPGSPYPHGVNDWAVRLVVDAGLPSRPARWPRWQVPRGFGPCATLQHGGEAGGKKGADADGHRRPCLGLGDVCGVWDRRCTLGRPLLPALRGRSSLRPAPPLCGGGSRSHPRGPPGVSGAFADGLGGPHHKAAGSATRPLLHPAVSGRPPAPEHPRTHDPVAHHL
jgi:hypothetical protein